MMGDYQATLIYDFRWSNILKLKQLKCLPLLVRLLRWFTWRNEEGYLRLSHADWQDLGSLCKTGKVYAH